jgi:50S ribosomal subunit-associated GTPase HflX
MDTMLMSKEKLLEQLEALKVAWESEFSDSVEFFKEEVERWLVQYINKNDDIEDTLHQLSIDLREMENELFEIKTKHEIIVAPMREYIEEWLTKALVKITRQINMKQLQQLCHLQDNNNHLQRMPQQANEGFRKFPSQ